MPPFFARTIWVLAVVSFFTDISSEILFPVLPLFFQSIGFTGLMIGLLEGMAEAAAGLSKIYFGLWSDRLGQRLAFVRAGYLFSAVAKPMLAVSTWVPWIFLSRIVDRLGKGMRTAPRDALLSEASAHEHRATVFGFHRAWDTAGALLGPILALLFLQQFPGQYVSLFLLAFIPALLSVLFTGLLREKRTVGRPATVAFSAIWRFWKQAPPAFRTLVAPMLLFAAFNSSDAFLLLRAAQVTGSDTMAIAAYLVYNAVYAVAAWPIGFLADRVGKLRILLAGMVLFGMVYSGMAMADTSAEVFFLFGLYGIYAAATEGVTKALISTLIPRDQTAGALGFYAGWQSICLLIASAVAGLVWTTVHPAAALLMGAAGTLIAALWLWFNHR